MNSAYKKAVIIIACFFLVFSTDILISKGVKNMNVTDAVRNIRTAIYGKDVRESIASGIESINTETENTTARQSTVEDKQNSLETEFDQLVINAGNSNAEIVQARVDEDGIAYASLQERLNKQAVKSLRLKSAHISIDDFELAFQDITNNAATYTSIFNNATFATLKSLHDTYGVKISCFCFGNNTFDISTTTTKFKQEFIDNSDWLKFGFHALKASANYGSATLATFKADYEKVKDAVISFAGEDSWCNVYRLHNFACTEEIKNQLIAYGCKGLLSVDDTRVSYDLTSKENDLLSEDGIYYKGLYYFKTVTRFENITDINTTLTGLSGKNNIVMFTHEPLISDNLAKIQTALQWLVDNGYYFTFLDEYYDARKTLRIEDSISHIFDYTNDVIMNSGFTIVSSRLSLVKQGPIVTLSAFINAPTTLPINTKSITMTLPSECIPKIIIVGTAYGDNGSDIVGICALIINTDGTVSVNPPSLSDNVRRIGINISWKV